MGKILRILVHHFRHEADWKLAALMLPFLAVCIYLNYYFDFEDSVLDGPYSYSTRRLLNFVTYAGSYFIPLVMYAALRRDWQLFRREGLVWVLLGVFVLFSLYATSTIQLSIAAEFPYETRYFVRLCAVNLLRGMVVVLPLLVYWWAFDRRPNPEFYGFRHKDVTLWPYFVLLALMVPLVWAASYDASFLRAYPRYRPSYELEYWNLPEKLAYLIFEFCYGVDFVFTEFFFRGFLILGLARFLGPAVLWPMVSFYCFVHFGKPAGETVSSVFGGYILGVIAYHTRSIYGGILIHLGVAWLMEFAAYVQKNG